MSTGKRAFAALALLLAVLIPAITTAFVSMDRAMAEQTLPVSFNQGPPVFNVADVNEDVLWLARCAYSETKRAEEQELVAWVIRNRVETGYRGQRSYRDAVLDPYQFSAFNPGSSKRRLYLNLRADSDAQGWRQALEVAHRVYYSPERDRPFAAETRHFYSERSMRGRMRPVWADGKTPVQVTRYTIDPRRFRFYSEIR